MNTPAAQANETAFANVLQKLEQAWNSGDGIAFAAVMSKDADFVTIRADHLRGREAISASHQTIFATIYAGSRNQLSLESWRLIKEDVALIHARSVLEAPVGPLAGRHEAMFSAVLFRDAEEWLITSFHITLAPA